MAYNSVLLATKLLCNAVTSTNLSSASGVLRCASFCRGINSPVYAAPSSCVKSFAPTRAVCYGTPANYNLGRSNPNDGVQFSSASTDSMTHQLQRWGYRSNASGELRFASACSVCRHSSSEGYIAPAPAITNAHQRLLCMPHQL